MRKAYLVQGRLGAFEERETWICAAFLDKEQAERQRDHLIAWLKKGEVCACGRRVLQSPLDERMVIDEDLDSSAIMLTTMGKAAPGYEVIEVPLLD